jgi:carbonic anhydrase/acetyltransferase-like protein (isoleucine patch superfamily)
MRDLILLGTGVHAAEMVEITARANAAGAAWNLLGVIASGDRAPEPGTEFNGCPVLGTRADLGSFAHAWFVPCNEWPRPSGVPRERLATLVDPSTFVSRTARLGAGCVVYPSCFIGLNAVLGDRVFMLSGSIVNHDVRLAEDVVVCSGVSLAGGVCVEPACYLGQACTIRQNLHVGRGSLIGMGSVVVKDVPAGVVVAGNPARKLRDAPASVV